MIDEYLFIPPNWKDSLKYTRRWMTTLMSSVNNAEQRSMLFTWPRRSLTFNILTKNYYETAYLKQRFFNSLNKIWGIPFWQDETVLTSSANSGQKILNLDTRWRNFDLNGHIVLFESPISWEVGVIDTISTSQITLKNNLQKTWPKNTSVFPILAGRLHTVQSYNMVLSSMVTIQIEINEEFNHEIIRKIGTAENYPTFKNFILFHKKPTWSENIEFKFIHPYEYIKFLGKTYSFTHYDETEFGLSASYLCRSKAEIQDYLDIFDYCRGRWREVWFPSYQQDIKIIMPFASSDTILKIYDIAFQTYWSNRMAGEYLKIDFPDESYVCRKISGYSPPNNLILESAIGKSANQSELPYITSAFLYFGRFNQDEIEVEYLTNEIGRINLTFQTTFNQGLM